VVDLISEAAPPPRRNAPSPEQATKLIQQPAQGESASALARTLGISRVTRAAQIVRSAVAASGLGEPWCVGPDDRSPDAVRVGDRLMVVEVDGDTYETLLTRYAIDDGTATPVESVGTDDGVRTLTAWIRDAGRPMAWTRVKPGQYRSGKYSVGQLDTGEWFAEGPGGVDQVFDRKVQAQAACRRAAVR